MRQVKFTDGAFRRGTCVCGSGAEDACICGAKICGRTVYHRNPCGRYSGMRCWSNPADGAV